jgi:D-alanyl-D-alanine carboxypeptidase
MGLAQSTFVNPDGLPDPPGQLMSALDLAKLSRHIINTYPDLYHYFSEREFVWHNIHQPNRDLVLGALPAPTASRPAIPMRPVTASPSRPSGAISA